LKKRFLSILLTAVLLLCAVPLGLGLVDTAYAAETVSSGSCGDNVTWMLTSDGTLTISGTGAMTDYYNSGATPWHSVCSQIKSVIIEDGVTRIGNYAFSYCDALAGVTIPDSVTTIGDQAFKDCKALTSMAIPGSVTMIGDWAFDGCGALTDIYYGGYGIDWLSASGNYCGIPSGTTVHFKSGYGKGSCGDNVSWVLPLDGTLTISGTGAMEDYDIDNAPWYSFRSQVKSVVIEDGVTRIGISAFKNCDALTDVTIPGSVIRIEDYAFSDCSALTSVTIPDGVTYIGSYAFSDCDSLASVTIPGSVTKIGGSVFYDCDALTDIYYDGYGIDWLKVYGHDQIPDSATVHYKEDLYGRGECGENVSWVMTADGTLTISGTGAMADYEWNGTPWASARSEIKSVVIGDGVTRIGDYAFQHCRVLTGAAIPASVTAIGDSAFYYCTSLASVTIPGGVTTIGDRAFAYCKTLTGVTIPNGVTGIDSYAFAWCSALTSAAIPGSVSDIGEYAFYECGALTDVYYGGYGMDWLAACDGSIVVPGGTTVHFKDDLYGSGSCGISARWVMDSDGTLTISGTGRISNYDPCHETSLAPAPWYAVRDYVQSVVIEDGITGIGNYAFYGCEELTSVTIPDGVTDIGDAAFGDCTSLTGVVIPAGVTAIRNKTFYGCVSLTSITLPQGMTSIGGSAFSDCISLTSVAIPDSVTRVETGAFDGCTSLTNVTLPKSLTRLGGEVFRDCTSLTGMTVPEGVDCIYGSTFANCTNLTSVTLPSTVNWIGDNAFFNCVRLSSVTIPKRVCYIYQDAFRSCDSLADVYYGGTTADWAKIVMEDGNGDLTHATLHCTAPAAPAAPVVTAGNSAVSGKPMLTWNAVEGATSYKVYRAAKEDGTYGLLGSTSATSYTNTGAKEGVTYYYMVTAVNDSGESAFSNTVSGQNKAVTPKPSAPVVKIGNSATSGKPMLTWNAVSGATSYKVYRATSKSGTYSLLGTVTATSYTNTGAKAGTTYYYKVKAVNSAGESAYSNTVSGRATVTILTMGHSASSGKPQLTWKAVSGAASYKVYRATAKNGAYTVINTTKALTYTNVGAALGTTYYYRVEALNAAGKSMGFSAVVEGKVAPVLAVGYSSVSGKPQLTWKAIPGATEYQVYRSTQQNSGYTKINTTTSTSYVNTGAKAGTTYYYRIVAVKGTAVSDFSNIVSARPGK
jgi:fibronectin type 3 domain-containing protein